ncbi:MAG TPA: apolipoprotein N-acyltransferase [Pyrinomonadaceae bacterium]|nr:apolipoprotein N-acyltransferase [Pyrinomonadaceae bacterium]
MAASLNAPARRVRGIRSLVSRAGGAAPTRAETLLSMLSAALLVLAFPDFELWPLAWVGLVPLLFAVGRRAHAGRAFLLGWMTGTLFFYASCYWLTHPMIHYAGIPAWLAYPLLLPAALAGGLFPALCAGALARSCVRWGARALLLAPLFWVSLEWARLGAVGQLWNAVGYSQAYVPPLIQGARFGGVYLVGFLVVCVNAALAYALLEHGRRAALTSAGALAAVALAVVGFDMAPPPTVEREPRALVVAVQPNVIPDFERPAAETARLAEEHFEMSARALDALDADRPGGGLPRVVVWPESPMNFSFARDARFREQASGFARARRASLLFNSLEPAPDGGAYNAAVLVNEEGRLAVQYDKIRLMPFGEYVPLPRWLPGAGMVRGVVGEFTPGTRYTLMPLGGADTGAPRAGVFICLESAYPHITRQFAGEGADVLIEITNDAYQGDTAILRQHMANAVFRAVETGRPLLRVTNTGLTARIDERGRVLDLAGKNRQEVRTWPVARSAGGETFYVKRGDGFVAACSFASFLALLLTYVPWLRRRIKAQS